VTADDWARSASPTAARIPADELAAVLARAAAIGVPARRVTTALGLPAPSDASADDAVATP